MSKSAALGVMRMRVLVGLRNVQEEILDLIPNNLLYLKRLKKIIKFIKLKSLRIA